MSAQFARLRTQERWIAWIRLGAVPWAVLEVGLVAHDYPAGYERWAWITTAAFGTGAIAFLYLSRLDLGRGRYAALGFAALVFDTAIIAAYVFIYTFEPATPTRALLVLVVVEGALRYGLRGGIALPLATVPLLILHEWWRADRFAPPPFELRYITLRLGVEAITGLIVGGLVRQLQHETGLAEARAAEAEGLRDQIGRRADQLEAVNRCARALASSLDLEEAFRLFAREARDAIAFDRLALVLANGGRAEVVANAGEGQETALPTGTSRPIEGSALEELLGHGRTIVRGDMADSHYAEEPELAAAGLHSRVVAPLSAAKSLLGLISVSRKEPNAFSREEVDLVTLLGRQVATAVENIRAFEAERTAADELRRLSALRADFVSLVSHELRGPMASVIGCAATLRARWRTLRPEQRESFLALIEEETSRLTALVGDVLDTSRLDAGTFSYTFSDVDVGELAREVAAVVTMGQEDVAVRAEVDGPLPLVRGDRDRIRQLLMNLLTNAVKYTVPGDQVEIRAQTDDGAVAVAVCDNGPGIAPEHQGVIFEKFGRATPAGNSKPGAGLGLYIARSIAEAHGGSLAVRSQPGAGATFVLRLPVRGSGNGP